MPAAKSPLVRGDGLEQTMRETGLGCLEKEAGLRRIMFKAF